MPTITALAAPHAGSPLAATTIDRRKPRPQDVVIEITHCGICHSDIHQARDEWGGARFPMVPGHEIVGHVTAIGPDVDKFHLGDRVGVGCFVDSCRTCEACLAGEEQYCLEGNTATYNAIGRDGQPTYGGYSTAIVVDQDYVLRIPDNLDSEHAAPLLCAGITMYSPMKHWNAGPGTRVAIIGMGGLGHVGVKIAHALGADVTVLSHTLSKQADGLAFGADAYYATSEPTTFETLANTFDLIVNTVSANLDVPAYLNLLRRDGTLVHVGIPTEPDSLKMWDLAQQRRSIAGSTIGGIRETQEMLDFCAQHDITAETELVTADHVNDAYEHVTRGDVRYRYVIDIETLR